MPHQSKRDFERLIKTLGMRNRQEFEKLINLLQYGYSNVKVSANFLVSGGYELRICIDDNWLLFSGYFEDFDFKKK